MKLRTFAGAAAAALLLACLGSAGCNDDAYCFSCDNQGAGASDNDAAADGADVKPDVILFDSHTDNGEGGCPPGTADCNLVLADGCEVNVLTDPKHCGSCDTPCALANAEPKCENGKCAVAECKPGFADCDNKGDNGCEVDTSTDADHCGGCTKPCPAVPGADPGCQAGQCTAFTCKAGFGDCDNNLANGCETNLKNSPEHCGLCTSVCTFPNPLKAHGTPACTDGACTVGTCDAGYADCDHSYYDGCETELATEKNHCGACDNKCDNPAHGTPKCVGGHCAIEACDPGFDDCNKDPADGCEVDLSQNVHNCGACGNDCPAVAHGQPGCFGFVCDVGSCDQGFANCFGGSTDGCETDTSNDPNHCGDCSTSCPAVISGHRGCENGNCVVSSCEAHYADCDGNLGNGCETDLLTDVSHCGDCSTPCATPPHGQPACENALCAIASCDVGFANCDNNVGNGCEYNTMNDPDHCGGCDTVCGTFPHTCTNALCDCNNTVLLIADDSQPGTTTLNAALTLAGLVVTQTAVPYYQYDGSNPPPLSGCGGNACGSIVLLAGGPAYSTTDIPVAGQTSIASFVAASNGLVLTEWAAKQVADGRWQTISDLVLLTRTVAFSGQVNYTIDPGFVGHPIWFGVPPTFQFPSTSNKGVTKIGSGIKRIAGSPEAIDAVAIRDLPNVGRVVHIAHAGNYSSNGWSNQNIQLVVSNAARWAARCN